MKQQRRSFSFKALLVAALLLYVVFLSSWSQKLAPAQDELAVLSEHRRGDEGDKTTTRLREKVGEEDLSFGERVPAICLEKPHAVVPQLSAPLLLASFPGSGNTWIRHVFQEGSRTLTGSMYNDVSLLERFPAEGKSDGSVVLVKTHFPCRNCWVNRKTGKVMPVKKTGDLAQASGTVYLIRSPFDALLAEFNRKNSNLSHTGTVDPAIFKTSTWTTFINTYSKSYVEHVKFYMASKMGKRLWRDTRGRLTYVVFFEKFVRDFESEVATLFNLVRTHFPKRSDLLPSNEDALACLAADKQGSFKRTKKKAVNPYTPAQVAMICSLTTSIWQERVWGPCDGKLQWERTT